MAAWALAGLLLSGGLIGGLHVARPQVIAALNRAVPAAAGEEGGSAEPKAEAKWQFLAERLGPQDLTWLAFLGGLVVAGGLGLATWRWGLSYCASAAILLTVLGVQLYLFGRQANATAPASYYTELPRTAVTFHQSHDWGREYGDPATEWQSFTGQDYRGYANGDLTPFFEEREVLRRNRAWLYGVPAAHAFYTLLPQRQVRLLDQLVPAGLAGKPSGAAAPLQVLRMLGVRALIAAPGLHSAWLRPVIRKPSYAYYRMTAPMSSAFLPLRVVSCASESESLAALSAPSFRPEETALVEGIPPPQAEKLGGAWAVARLTSTEAERMGWEVQSPRPAFLVMNMSYNPHWRATVNGKSSTVYRTNYVQCGVTVPAGKSRVEAWYWEDEFWLGLEITKITAVALAALLLVLGIAEAVARRRAARRP